MRKKFKNFAFQSAMMCRVTAISMGETIGGGYIILDENLELQRPEFYGDNHKMEQGWYTLQITHDEWMVVVPRNVQ